MKYFNVRLHIWPKKNFVFFLFDSWMTNGSISRQKAETSFPLLHAVNISFKDVLEDSETDFNFEYNLLKSEV